MARRWNARDVGSWPPMHGARDVAHLPITDLAAFLRGAWRVEREFHDAAEGRRLGSFRGVARLETLAASEEALDYREDGTVQLGDHRGRAGRRLTYDLRRGRAVVRFADGRWFHDLDLRAGVWTVTHPCGEDVYHGRFEVDGPDGWRHRWTVRGPRKDQLIVTTLERHPRSVTVDL